MTAVRTPLSSEVTFHFATGMSVKLKQSKWRFIQTNRNLSVPGSYFDYEGIRYEWNFRGTLLKRVEDGELVASVHESRPEHGRLEIYELGTNMIDIIVGTFMIVWDIAKSIHIGYWSI